MEQEPLIEKEKQITISDIEHRADDFSDRIWHVYKEHDNTIDYQTITHELNLLVESLRESFPNDDEAKKKIFFLVTTIQDIFSPYDLQFDGSKTEKEDFNEFDIPEKIKEAVFSDLMRVYTVYGKIYSENFSPRIVESLLDEAWILIAGYEDDEEVDMPDQERYEWIMNRLPELFPQLKERFEMLFNDPELKGMCFKYFHTPKYTDNPRGSKDDLVTTQQLVEYISERVSKG